MDSSNNEALHKRIKELEATIASQEDVITDQVDKLEMATLSKTMKAETFSRDGKFYKINHPRIIIPGDGTSPARKVTSAQVAKDTGLQDAIFEIEGCNSFTEIKAGEKPTIKTGRKKFSLSV